MLHYMTVFYLYYKLAYRANQSPNDKENKGDNYKGNIEAMMYKVVSQHPTSELVVFAN